MRLQVRVRHSLGEKVVELPARGVDHPVVIGRGAAADLQIPSLHIGQSHLALFIHEGKWVVQDGPDSTGTLIDGKPLATPRILYGGEVLRLGPEGKAAAVEIDPGGALSAGAPVPVTGGIGEQPAPDPDRVDSDHVDWAAEPLPASYYVPKPLKSSPIIMGASIVIAVLIVAGAAVFIYVRKAATPKVVTVVVPEQRAKTDFPRASATRRSAETASKTTIFDVPPAPPDITDQLDEAVATTKPTTSHVASATTTTTTTTHPIAPVAPAAAAADPTEDAEQARAWKHVQDLYYDADPAKPLLAMETFERDYPGAHTAELAKYRDDLFDKLWWMRIDGLCDRRKTLNAAIAETQEKIKKESEEAYKKTVLEPQLANQKAKLAAVNERLAKDMTYRSADPPPIGKEAEIAKLRSQRVASVYENWKKQVMKALRDSHGQLPWANER
jgi:hypothetical protein